MQSSCWPFVLGMKTTDSNWTSNLRCWLGFRTGLSEEGEQKSDTDKILLQFLVCFWSTHAPVVPSSQAEEGPIDGAVGCLHWKSVDTYPLFSPQAGSAVRKPEQVQCLFLVANHHMHFKPLLFLKGFAIEYSIIFQFLILFMILLQLTRLLWGYQILTHCFHLLSSVSVYILEKA